MPSASCRDVDEACDWFMRDDDHGKLLTAAVLHFEEMHSVLFKEHLATRGPATICQDFMNVWRY